RKRGSLWSFTDWHPFIDYAVNPAWVTGWWCVQKFSHQQYASYLLQCRRAYKTNLQNAEAVEKREKELAVRVYQKDVVQKLIANRAPFRATSDPMFSNLPAFRRQFEFACEILDNINDWAFILEHRALLQANADFHKLGESQTGVFSYTVFLWATPVAITLDLDVDSQSAFECSDWLRANVLLDVLKPGDKTFLEEGRPKLRMSDMPELQLDIVL
ncbi:unnamed protein product, partial [Durusdinium trenchii]